MFLLIDGATNQLVSEHEEEPNPRDGEQVRQAIAGYGSIYRWSAERAGFEQIPAPPATVPVAMFAALLDRLVAEAVLSPTTAAEILGEATSSS